MSAKNIVLVHQMGKVGSSTVVASLEAAPHGLDLFQIHTLRPEVISRISDIYNNWSASSGRNYLPEHYFGSRHIRELMDSGRGPDCWKVVTLIRDPVSRNVSSFFENLETLYPALNVEAMVAEQGYDGTARALIDLFMRDFKHELPLTWFDDEIKAIFGIDVYADAFPRERGYTRYSNDRADLLLLRLEDLSTSAAPAFSEFLDIENLKLVNANLADDKAYKDLYGRFKKFIQFPDSYLTMMYQSRFMTHFYSRDEIEQLRAKWIG